MTDHPGAGAPEEQSLLSKISIEVVRTLKAKSYLLDEFLIVVMRGGVTVAEQTMLDRGHSDLVRTFRQTYQNELGDELVAKVEVLTRAQDRQLPEPDPLRSAHRHGDLLLRWQRRRGQLREASAGLRSDPRSDATITVTNP